MCTPRAEYLQSAHETSVGGKTNFAVPSGLQDEIDELFYHEWHISNVYNKYKFVHEPLFSTLLQVNRQDGENLDMYVSVDDQAEFLLTGSVDYCYSITAFAMHGTPARKPPAGRGNGTGKTTARKPNKKVMTDIAWKGVWQGIMDKSKTYSALPAYSDVLENLKSFHSDITSGVIVVNLCLAPFKKVIALDKYEAKIGAEELDDAIKEWLAGLKHKPEHKKRSRRTPIQNRRRSVDGGSGGTRKRSGPPLAEGEASDVDTGEEEEDMPSVHDMLDDLDDKQIATLRAEVRTLSYKLTTADKKTEKLESQVTKLAATCDELKRTTSAPQVSDRAETITLVEHRKELGEQEVLISSGLKHEEQNRMLVGILGTVFSQTRTLLLMAQGLAATQTGNTTAPANNLADDLTKPMYTQIITMVNDTWAWTNSQKRSFYGSFQQIPVFKTEYDLVKAKE